MRKMFFKSSFVDPGSSMRTQFSIDVTEGQSKGGGLFANIQMHAHQLLLSNTKGTLRLRAGG